MGRAALRRAKGPARRGPAVGIAACRTGAALERTGGRRHCDWRALYRGPAATRGCVAAAALQLRGAGAPRPMRGSPFPTSSTVARGRRVGRHRSNTMRCKRMACRARQHSDDGVVSFEPDCGAPTRLSPDLCPAARPHRTREVGDVDVHQVSVREPDPGPAGTLVDRVGTSPEAPLPPVAVPAVLPPCNRPR